jgi:hypothetical protein
MPGLLTFAGKFRRSEKMEPMMAMIDFGFNAAGKDQSPARRRVAKPR